DDGPARRARGVGVVRLDADDEDVGDLGVAGIVGSLDRNRERLLRLLDREAPGPEPLEVLPARDEKDILAHAGEHPAEIPAHGARSEDDDAHEDDSKSWMARNAIPVPSNLQEGRRTGR